MDKIIPLLLAIIVWFLFYHSAKNKFDFFKGALATAVVLGITALFLSGL